MSVRALTFGPDVHKCYADYYCDYIKTLKSMKLFAFWMVMFSM